MTIDKKFQVIDIARQNRCEVKFDKNINFVAFYCWFMTGKIFLELFAEFLLYVLQTIATQFWLRQTTTYLKEFCLALPKVTENRF